MLTIRNLRVENVLIVAKMVALDHDEDAENGYLRSLRAHF